jgi:HSP20 family protein
MSEDLIRLVHSLFWPLAETQRVARWEPSADVYRTRKGWLVKFDLAGVRPGDFSLTVQGSCLRVQGTRRDCSLEEGCSHYRMEIAYSRFERLVDLPCNLQLATIATDYRDGMLLVHIYTEIEK